MRWHVGIRGGLVLLAVGVMTTPVEAQVGGRIARRTLGRAAAEGFKEGIKDVAIDSVADKATGGAADAIKDAVKDSDGAVGVAANAAEGMHDAVRAAKFADNMGKARKVARIAR